ncbi:MAG TPA: hypothetical protein VGC06_10610 [Actinomycetes bacterium]
MELDKNQILDFLREQGQSDKVSQAEQELPDHVDTDQHADLLQRFGINPQELMQKFMGRGGIPSL